MRGQRLWGIAAFALPLLAGYFPAAQADDTRFYAGAEDLAHARIKVKSRSLRAAGLPAAEIREDRSETGWRLFAGYRLNPYLAVECSYATIGDFSLESPAPGGTVRVDSMKVKATSADIVTSWPVRYNVSLYARGGIVHSKTDVSVTAEGAAAVPRSSFSAKDWGYRAGVGVGWDPHEHVGMRLGWEHARVADGIGRDAGVDLLSWGLRVQF